METNYTEVYHFSHTLWGISTYVSLATTTTSASFQINCSLITLSFDL